jgi:predicted PurR-regulated permease PerM
MSQIKAFLKYNLSAIIFFAFIAFAIFSLISSNNQISDRVKELVAYSRSSLEKINNDFEQLMSTSSTSSANASDYDLVIGIIKNSQKNIQQMATQVPNKISEDNAQQLIKQLQETFRDTNIDYDYIVKRLDTEKLSGKAPSVDMAELRTQNYSKHVSSVQSSVNTLAKKYSLS